MASAKSLESDSNTLIQRWKIQRMLRDLSQYKGSGTSVVTLIIKDGASIAPERANLTEQLGKASNVKSRVNRQSVMSAITSAQHVLKKYNHTPKNGLVIFSGEVTNQEGKTKKIVREFVPPEPLRTKGYYCDSEFHLDDLDYLLKDNNSYGYVVVDGSGAVFATVSGTNKIIHETFGVDLPKKHRKGGQSAARFGRLRLEAIQAYITKVAERINKHYISGDSVNVDTIILAGCGDKKDLVVKSPVLDHRVESHISKKTLDVSYGGESGLNQAIKSSAEFISGLLLSHEREVIEQFMGEIKKDTGLYFFGAQQIVDALTIGAVETLIIWSELDLIRYETSSGQIICAKPTQVPTSVTIVNEQPLSEWLVDNAPNMGVTNVELVSDSTAEGHQFCIGFGGIGAITRWKLEGDEYDADADAESDDDWGEDDFI